MRPSVFLREHLKLLFERNQFIGIQPGAARER